MIDVLARFEDRNRDTRGRLLNKNDNDRAITSLLKVIVIFAKAFRFRSIYLAVGQRIRNDENSSEIDCSHWLLLHDWDHCSRHLLALCQERSLTALSNVASAYFQRIKVRMPGSDELRVLSTLDNVIGSRGELLFIRSYSIMILSNKELAELERATRRKPVPVPEPGFKDVLLPDESDDPESLWIVVDVVFWFQDLLLPDEPDDLEALIIVVAAVFCMCWLILTFWCNHQLGLA